MLDAKLAVSNIGGMKLADYLRQNDITAAAFADLIGMSDSHLSLIMSGKRGASLAVVQRISAATEGAVTADDFLSPHEALKATA